MKTPRVLLEWTTVQNAEGGGSGVCVSGRVYGHPKFPPGETIVTSALVAYRQDGEALVVWTRSGSEYILNRPMPNRPFATGRLMRLLASTLGSRSNVVMTRVGRVQDLAEAAERSALELGG